MLIIRIKKRLQDTRKINYTPFLMTFVIDVRRGYGFGYIFIAHLILFPFLLLFRALINWLDIIIATAIFPLNFRILFVGKWFFPLLVSVLGVGPLSPLDNDALLFIISFYTLTCSSSISTR